MSAVVPTPIVPAATGEDLRPVLSAAAARLATAGVASPRHDAEALAAHVLATSRAGLLLVDRLTGPQAQQLQSLVRQRADRVPLQHLVGSVGFRRLTLAVGSGVFVPRPETETLVELALAAVAGQPAPLVVDLGTGSGAVALAVAQEHPGARVHAVERDPVAAGWASRNIAATRLPVSLHTGSMDEPQPELDGRVDLVVSNPPYIPTAVRGQLEPEVVEHDPAMALWGGPDGLDGPRMVVTAARRLLAEGGSVVLEHDAAHGDAVPALLSAAGFVDVARRRDLVGRPRFSSARLPGGRP